MRDVYKQFELAEIVWQEIDFVSVDLEPNWRISKDVNRLP